MQVVLQGGASDFQLLRLGVWPGAICPLRGRPQRQLVRRAAVLTPRATREV